MRESRERLLREALTQQQEICGPLHYEVGITLLHLGAVLRERDLLKELEESETVLRDADKILNKARGPFDWDTTLARNELGTCLLKRGKRDEAKRVFTEIHRVLAYQLGASHPRTRRAKAKSGR